MTPKPKDTGGGQQRGYVERTAAIRSEQDKGVKERAGVVAEVCTANEGNNFVVGEAGEGRRKS